MKLFSIFGELLLKDSLTPGIDKAGEKAKGLSGIFSSSFGSIAGAALKLGAILGVSMGFSSLFAKAEAGQKTMAQMDAVLKSTGGTAGMTKDALVNLANSQAKVTTFSAGTTKAAENLLLTFTGISKKTFPDTIKAAQDMSTAMGTDLNSSVMTLGKALNNPAEGMSRLTKQGVTFNDQQKKQIEAMTKAGDVAGAQAVMLKELQKEFGGSAEAAGKTFAGQLTILQNQLTGVGVGIVSKLLPPLTEFMTSINNHMPQIQAVIGDVVNFIGQAINTLTPIVKSIISDVVQIATNLFPKMGSSGSDLGNQLLGLAKGGLALVKDALDWFAQHGEATKAIITTIGTAFIAWKGIQGVVGTITNVKNAITTVTNTVKNVKSGIDTARIAFMYLNDGVLSVSTRMSNFGSKILSGVGTGISKIGSLAKSAGSAILDFGKAAVQGAVSLAKMTLELGKQAIAWVAQKAQLVASTVAEGAATIAQTALNLAMSLNPITIVIIAIAGLVAAIVLLYNKNEWFRNGVNSVFSFVKSFVMGVINSVIGFFHNLVSGVESAGNSIRNGFNTVVNWFASLPSRFVQFGSNMINGLKNGISSVLGTIGSVISNGFNSAINFLTSLPGKALAWGRDFIDGLKNGIMSGVQGIVSAVSGIADKIKSFLHFSRPDEGALADYETWMPDFMSGLSSSIDKNKFKVIDSIKGLSSDMNVGMKLNPSLAMAGTPVAGNININSANNNKPKQPIILQIPLNGRVVAEQTYEDISELQENKTLQDGRNIGNGNSWRNI
ncbi:MAG: phage tail length tape measure family protein [Clostridium sp.]|uniref:phage tail length tape measure family protein n=1 Tax=Clostridium sp. TaxID=1506 RepID=UPI0039EC262F